MQCSICLNELIGDNKIRTICGHDFHKNCLDDWLHIRNNCPECRKDNPVTQLYRINNIETLNNLLQTSTTYRDFQRRLFIQTGKMTTVVEVATSETTVIYITSQQMLKFYEVSVVNSLPDFKIKYTKVDPTPEFLALQAVYAREIHELQTRQLQTLAHASKYANNPLYICNPVSGRYVLRTGRTGRQIRRNQ